MTNLTKTLTLTAALLLTAAAAHANPTLEGCETKPAANAAGGTGYYNLVDATCVALNPGRDFDFEAPAKDDEGPGEGGGEGGGEGTGETPAL
jgi:hypothetical protein